MMIARNMNIQEIELRLIENDTEELRAVLIALNDHNYSGYLSLALSPITGFVTEESHKYLSSRNLISGPSSLFDNYTIAVKKSRALLKLFDDKEGGFKGLLELLQLFQNKSSLWMKKGRHGLLGFILRNWLQPDIGIYFLDEDPIYLSIVGFSAAGKTKQEIESLGEGDFGNISEQAKSYGFAIGEYFAAIREILIAFGVPRKSEVRNSISPTINITHNDFLSAKLYKQVAKIAKLTDANIAPALLFVLTQVNIAYILLPRLLPLGSDLLVRIQFLSAYHATRSLIEIQRVVDGRLSHISLNWDILTSVPNIKKIRNVLAHYGLGEGKKFISGGSDSLNEVILGLSGITKSDLLERSNNQLRHISEWCNLRLSKTKLKSIRALLGDHT